MNSRFVFEALVWLLLPFYINGTEAEKRIAWLQNNLGINSRLANYLQQSHELQHSNKAPTQSVATLLKDLQDSKNELAINHDAHPCLERHISTLQELCKTDH